MVEAPPGSFVRVERGSVRSAPAESWSADVGASSAFRQWLNFSFDFRCRLILGYLKLVLGLKVHPHLCRRSEESSESQRGIGRNGTPPVDDFGQPVGWNPQGQSCRIGGKPGLFQLAFQYSPRVNGGTLGGGFVHDVISFSGSRRFQPDRHSSRHSKQTRYWLLIRMLYCPFRLPDNFSRRMLGMDKSLGLTAAFN